MPTKSQAARFRENHKIILSLLDVANALLVEEPSAPNIENFKGKFAKLDYCKNKLDEVYAEIVDSKDLEEKLAAQYDSAYATACEAYFSILGYSSEIVSKSSSQPSISPSAPPAAVLPKIELPKFSSKIEDWPSFMAIFKSLTDSIPGLTNAVKLHYLLSALSGEAFSLVSHLKITNENYAVAIDVLTKRYENRRVLIDRFVDIIMDLPNISLQSNIREKFLTPLISAQSALQNLNLPMEGCDYVFVSIVARKLKGELRSLFERSHGSTEVLPKLQDLVSFLDEHARYVETEQASMASENVQYHPVESPRNSEMSSRMKSQLHTSQRKNITFDLPPSRSPTPPYQFTPIRQSLSRPIYNRT